MLNKLVLAAVAVGFMGSTAMAADMMLPPPPQSMMTSGRDGPYVGVDGSVFTGPGVQGDVFAGVNMTVAESFLIGGEGSIGVYNLLPGLGVEVTGALRGGFIA